MGTHGVSSAIFVCTVIPFYFGSGGVGFRHRGVSDARRGEGTSTQQHSSAFDRQPLSGNITDYIRWSA
ncbi:hypothetical protein PGT21_033651 [Puccinia graminis f. sp. tritici]|uniref:Uncharacterized protein n=1 Tax=Puccinia graminis f. sp. tritici TaxID=56615 RepID=A0A5B0M5F5_PUCGR|nr:hypothetical protein PGT21_033651 [Puccinia graminis f. sp. tritici]